MRDSAPDIVICPHCLRRVGDDGTCPMCGRRVRVEDWVVNLPRGARFNPCGVQGLEPPLVEGFPYRGADVEDAVLGTTRQGEGFCYLPNPEDGSYCIGGDSCSDVVIAGVPGMQGVHAVLVEKNCPGFAKGWWIFDCGNDAVGTYVNRRRVVRSHLLMENDRIEIAGVPFRFFRGRLYAAKRRFTSDVDDVVVENLTAISGEKKLLDRIGFSVRKGEFIGIVGPSGCGKSSLIQRLAQLAEFSGRIEVQGRLLDGNAPYSSDFKGVAYLPQTVEQSLHDALTLEQEVEASCRIYGVENDPEVLVKLSLKDIVEDRKPIGRLSGGEKRRVGIALALLRHPDVLLLDEPCAGLDPSNSRILMEHLYKLASNDGKTILCATHVMDDARLFDRVLVLREGGRVDFYDSYEKLMANYRCSSLSEVYKQLRTESVRPTESTLWEKVRKGLQAFSKEKKGTFLRRFWTNLRRSCRNFLTVNRRDFDLSLFWTRFGGYVSRSYRDRSKWAWCMYLFLQPALIVVGLRLACAYCFRETDDGVRLGSDMLDFCAVLSVFWLSLNNSAREFVKERIPGRCLERQGGVPLLPYVLSKYVRVFIGCALQVLVFVLMFKGAAAWNVLTVGAGRVPEVTHLTIPLLVVVPLLASSVMGACCGLAVSAASRRDIGAVMFVPNLAILALLFSKEVVRFDLNGIGYVDGVRKLVESYMPCYLPTQAVSEVYDGIHRTVWPAIGLMFAYVIASLVIAWIFQQIHERGWKGR